MKRGSCMVQSEYELQNLSGCDDVMHRCIVGSVGLMNSFGVVVCQSRSGSVDGAVLDEESSGGPLMIVQQSGRCVTSLPVCCLHIE